MVKQDIMGSLGFLGLSEKESSIYLYVCSNPNITAGKVIKDLKIARSKTYDALEKLESIGLISKDYRGVAKYSSSGGETLSDIYKKRVREVGKAIEYILRGTGGISFG
jgi:sugar-specific transcriptional regulator TrmB